MSTEKSNIKKALDMIYAIGFPSREEQLDDHALDHAEPKTDIFIDNENKKYLSQMDYYYSAGRYRTRLKMASIKATLASFTQLKPEDKKKVAQERIDTLERLMNYEEERYVSHRRMVINIDGNAKAELILALYDALDDELKSKLSPQLLKNLIAWPRERVSASLFTHILNHIPENNRFNFITEMYKNADGVMTNLITVALNLDKDRATLLLAALPESSPQKKLIQELIDAFIKKNTHPTEGFKYPREQEHVIFRPGDTPLIKLLRKYHDENRFDIKEFSEAAQKIKDDKELTEITPANETLEVVFHKLYPELPRKFVFASAKEEKEVAEKLKTLEDKNLYEIYQCFKPIAQRIHQYHLKELKESSLVDSKESATQESSLETKGQNIKKLIKQFDMQAKKDAETKQVKKTTGPSKKS